MTMRLGMRIRGLWQLRRSVACCGIFALLTAVWSVAHVSLLPPRLESRSLEMATAWMQVVVYTP